MQGARAVVRDDDDVALFARQAGQRAGCLVEDPVDVGHRALEPVALPVRPAEVLDVVRRHEDYEQELGLEALGEPHNDLDLLRRGPPDEVEVELAVGDREPVVELERAEARLQIGAERLWKEEPVLARRGVEAGEGKPVHLGRRPRKGDVDDAHPPRRRAQPVPDGGRTPKAPVHEAELIAALVALREVPDPVAAGVDAGDDRRPRVRGERVRGRAEHPPCAAVAELRDVRELTRGQHRIDDVEGRRV